MQVVNQKWIGVVCSILREKLKVLGTLLVSNITFLFAGIPDNPQRLPHLAAVPPVAREPAGRQRRAGGRGGGAAAPRGPVRARAAPAGAAAGGRRRHPPLPRRLAAGRQVDRRGQQLDFVVKS